jgi:SAM-dependent methyltransferase
MQNDPLADVPSPIDLRSMTDAHEWARTAMTKRPWRKDFFARIADELSRVGEGPLAVLELGSGPGFLARHLLSAVRVSRYCALDSSAAMHELAQDRLGALADRVEFVEADFRSAHWAEGLPVVEAVVTVQAVHELRHKRHAVPFYRRVRPLIAPGGVMLMCDHFAGHDGMSNGALYMTPGEHADAVREGGFMTIDVLLQKGGLILLRACGAT